MEQLKFNFFDLRVQKLKIGVVTFILKIVEVSKVFFQKGAIPEMIVSKPVDAIRCWKQFVSNPVKKSAVYFSNFVRIRYGIFKN